MNPRLKTSQKWTGFPEELLEQIKSIVAENFQKLAPEAQFLVDGKIYQQEVLFKIGFIKPNSIIQTNIWVSGEYDTKKDNVKNTLNLVIDCAGSLLAHHFDQPEEEFPIEWTEFEFNKKKLFICLDRSNDELEAQANALLGEKEDKALVYTKPKK